MGTSSSVRADPSANVHHAVNSCASPGFVTAVENRHVPRHHRPFQPPATHQYQSPNVNNQQPPIHKKDLVVIAIDFGMTFTGYAFGFQHDTSRVFTATAGGKLAEDRVPTTVLLKPDERFHSFGFNAEEDYTALIKKGTHKEWKFFEKFKMALYETENIQRKTPVYDREGRAMLAIRIFSMIIHYLKEQVESHLCQNKGSIKGSEFKWLISIPAIWSDSAKQFMREAALNAGIDQDKLHLVLEPEAAATYCLEQAAQWQRQYFDKNQQVVEFCRGFKYILADLGGGTADICVHEIIEGANIKEIYCATGDALGGSYVNTEFIKFLQKLVGANVIHELKQNQAENYLNLLRDFERKKKEFCKDTKDLRFSIPPDFCDLIHRMTGEKLHEVIPQTAFADKVQFKPNQNKLIISNETVKTFFDNSVSGIIQKLRDVLTETNDPDIKTLILVGGYSESPYLTECIESEFQQLRVLYESDGRLAVLKGAVMLGFKPAIIQQRRARFSYGFYMIQHYEETMPQELKLYHDGTFYCDRIFLKLIEKGETLTLGRTFKYNSTNKVLTPQAKMKPFLVRMVRSTKKDPKFCTKEEECTVIGNVKVQPPMGGWPNITNLTLHITVGETEFLVNVLDEYTLETYEAEINFL